MLLRKRSGLADCRGISFWRAKSLLSGDGGHRTALSGVGSRQAWAARQSSLRDGSLDKPLPGRSSAFPSTNAFLPRKPVVPPKASPQTRSPSAGVGWWWGAVSSGHRGSTAPFSRGFPPKAGRRSRGSAAAGTAGSTGDWSANPGVRLRRGSLGAPSPAAAAGVKTRRERCASGGETLRFPPRLNTGTALQDVQTTL